MSLDYARGPQISAIWCMPNWNALPGHPRFNPDERGYIEGSSGLELCAAISTVLRWSPALQRSYASKIPSNARELVLLNTSDKAEQVLCCWNLFWNMSCLLHESIVWQCLSGLSEAIAVSDTVLIIVANPMQYPTTFWQVF